MNWGGKHMKSVWEQTGEHRDFAPLKGDISTDVLIIGGGMAGIEGERVGDHGGVGRAHD